MALPVNKNALSCGLEGRPPQPSGPEICGDVTFSLRCHMGTPVIGLINNAYLLRELWLTPIFLAGSSDLWFEALGNFCTRFQGGNMDLKLHRRALGPAFSAPLSLPVAFIQCVRSLVQTVYNSNRCV